MASHIVETGIWEMSGKGIAMYANGIDMRATFLMVREKEKVS